MIFNFFGFLLLIFRVLGTSCLFFIPFLLDTSQMSNKRGRRPWVFPAMPSPPRQSQGQGEAWHRSAAEPAHPQGESGHRQPRGEGEVDLWGFVSVLSIAGAVSAGGGGMEGWMLRCIVAEEAFWGGGRGKRWCPRVLGSPPRCPHGGGCDTWQLHLQPHPQPHASGGAGEGSRGRCPALSRRRAEICS